MAPGDDDDETARQARARALRGQIDRLTKKGPPATSDDIAPPGTGGEAAETPAEFVKRRMRELDPHAPNRGQDADPPPER